MHGPSRACPAGSPRLPHEPRATFGLTHRASSSLSLLACLLCACGPRNEMVAVDIAFVQHGDGTAVKTISVIHVDSEGAPWQATHAAGVSASVSPDDRMAMSLCQVLDGGPRGGAALEFRGLELGDVTIDGADVELSLNRIELEAERGVAYRAEPDINDLPYSAGHSYTAQASGSEQAPGFTAPVVAPATYQVEMVGLVSAGAGTIPIPRNQDLRITWSPGSDESEMFMTLETATQGLVCRVPDTGEFTIKRRHLSNLVPGRGDLVLERYKQAEFDTSSGSDGKARSGRARYGVQRRFRFDIH